MADKKGRLIDDGKAEPVLRKDRSRPFPTSAWIEIVTVEIEQHHPCPPDLLEQRVEPDRVQAPRTVKFVKTAERRRRGRDDRVYIVRGIGCHQREKGAEGLSGQNDAMIALMLEPRYLVDKARRVLSVSVSPSRGRSKRNMSQPLSRRIRRNGGVAASAS